MMKEFVRDDVNTFQPAAPRTDFNKTADLASSCQCMARSCDNISMGSQRVTWTQYAVVDVVHPRRFAMGRVMLPKMWASFDSEQRQQRQVNRECIVRGPSRVWIC